MSENQTPSSHSDKKNLSTVVLEVVLSALVSISAGASIATWSQIHDSARKIVRLETQIITLERLVENSQSANQRVGIIESKLDAIDRRLIALEEE